MSDNNGAAEMTNETKLYAEREFHKAPLREYYCRHVDHMTREGLHAKSDIAAELAFRDAEIDRLKQYEQSAGILAIEKAEQRIRADAAEKELDRLRARVASLEESLHYANGVADLAMKHRDDAEKRVAELEPNDRRYRWLRGIDATASVHWHDDSADDGLIRDLLDAAIDSAMGAKP